MNRILIVEDEARIAAFVAKGLKAEGFAPTVVADGITGLDYALTGEFDLMVLDIGLPGMSGFGILERVAVERPGLPIIVLTARDSVTDTVAALEGGAADYMSKPFRFGELLARVRLRLRAQGDAPPDDALTAGAVTLDLRNRGLVLSREQLLSQVWGYDFDPGSNIVDVYVGYLRKKLGADLVTTVRGAGYRVE